MPWKQIIDNWTQALNAKYPDIAKTLKATLDQYGGVGGFIQQLRDPATQEKLKTWFKDGKEFVLSQDQVQKLLGNEKLKAIATKLSTTPEQVTQQLMQILPPLLEKLQKASQAVPEDGVVGKAIASVKNLFGGAKS